MLNRQGHGRNCTRCSAATCGSTKLRPMHHDCISGTAACLRTTPSHFVSTVLVCRAAWGRLHCVPHSQSTMGVFLRPTCWSNSSRGRRQFLCIRQVPVSNFRIAYCFQVGFRNPTTMSIWQPCSLHPVCYKEIKTLDQLSLFWPHQLFVH